MPPVPVKMMEKKTQYYAPNRKKWREWLAKHHAQEKSIWLIYYKKHTGKPRVSYADAVEEALCFGWIDSTANGIDEEKYCQRFSPRKNTTNWSEPNLERARRMIKENKMTPAGLKVLPPDFYVKQKKAEKGHRPKLSEDIKKALQNAPPAWKNYQSFDHGYQRIRIAWIEAVRHRPETFKTRLNYFIKKTQKGKRYGMMEPTNSDK